MNIKKLDMATEILEDLRGLHHKLLEFSADNELKSRELAIVITEVETAKLWAQEMSFKAQSDN